MSERELELREKSGTISTTDSLAVLLYVLIKDYLTATQMEEILSKVRETMPGTVVFNNGWLGKYALELKEQIEQLRNQNAIDKLVVPAKFEIILPEDTILEEAEAILGRLQQTMPKEEYERVKQEVKDYELEQAFKDLVIEEEK